MASLVFAPVLVPPRILPLPDLWPFALLPHLSNVMAPPEPPDPPDPTYGLVGLSSFSPFIMLFMFADLQSKLVLAWVVLVPLMPFDGTPFVSLRYLTVVCSAWYQSLPLASLELWFSTPRLSHSLVTLSQGFVLICSSRVGGFCNPTLLPS
ncbi:putative transmembrane protein At3g54730 isoform X4 [Capsella rubella]|uniref:putative transmembrane protein At3g54730 isoform X4 n=1 Tax=Capsella rubella TaxID=81985 RepID=UPI000CD59E0D|nr:putative transmembrane protein At3g54730 isoform X4 [Capsella rubella]